VGQKTAHQTHGYTSVKSLPIFRILSLEDYLVNWVNYSREFGVKFFGPPCKYKDEKRIYRLNTRQRVNRPHRLKTRKINAPFVVSKKINAKYFPWPRSLGNILESPRDLDPLATPVSRRLYFCALLCTAHAVMLTCGRRAIKWALDLALNGAGRLRSAGNDWEAVGAIL